MSMLSKVIKDMINLKNDILKDEEEKRLEMIAKKRAAKRAMSRNIINSKQKITDIQQEIENDEKLGKKYALEGNLELAAVQAEKVLFKKPVLQKFNRGILEQEKILFFIEATEDINTFNQELVAFDKIDQINNNPDLIGLQAEAAIDRITANLDFPAITTPLKQEPTVISDAVQTQIDKWLGQGTESKTISQESETSKLTQPGKKEEIKSKLDEVSQRLDKLNQGE